MVRSHTKLGGVGRSIYKEWRKGEGKRGSTDMRGQRDEHRTLKKGLPEGHREKTRKGASAKKVIVGRKKDGNLRRRTGQPLKVAKEA